MLIPSIDVMGGKIVQLVHGERKALESSDFDYWVERFSGYPLVQLVDLDAAMGKPANTELIARFLARLPCQLGGGIRSVEAARSAISTGARRVIVGSALFRDAKIQVGLAAELAKEIGSDKLTFSVDAKQGRVAIHGWKTLTEFTAVDAMKTLQPWCSAFLYTHVDTEGTLAGFPLQIVAELKRATTRRLMLAGGISSMQEVEQLDAIGADAIVGMAIYTGKMKA